MKIKSTTLAVLATSILTLSALGCDGEGTNSPGSSGGGYADLGISLNNLDDESVSIASDTANDLHVLAFWATWCVPCTGELAQMKDVHAKLADRGVKIYAISIDSPDTISRVPGFAAQEEWPFPVLYDSDTAVMARWNPKGDIPFYVVLDADGNVLKTHQGYVKGDVDKLEQFLIEKLPAE